ncbi:MAG: hypothetical protein RDU41_00180 [Clostridia bacterium]|nr:hypothetical protein [Clostridia bacterium]
MPGSNRSAGKGKRRLRYELPPCPITGRRRQRCETIHGTKADGDRILRERYREIDQGLHTKNITVVQMAEKYLGKYVANHCKTTTYESYEEQLRVHILPALGHLHLDKLNRETVQGFLNAKLAENSKHGRPRSVRAVEYMHTVLKAMLNVAVEWEYLHYNPAILKASWNTRKIKRERPPKQVVILTREQVDQFFLITQNNPSFYVVYVLALLSGLRRGELLGLTWTW